MSYGRRVNVGPREQARRERIDLGLAIGRALLQPGETRTSEQIASFCDCTKTTIQAIEARALQKCKLHLRPFLDA